MKKVIKKPGKINANRGKPVSKFKSKTTLPTLGFGQSVPLGVFERIGDVGCNTKTIGLKKSERSGYQPTTYHTIQLASMKELVKELKHTACDYTTGIARDELSGVMCKTKATKGPGEIARCKDDLVYPDGPGFAGLDFDGHYPKYKGIGEAIDIFPDGSSLAQVRRASTGSYDQLSLADPHEPDKGPNRAMLYVNRGRIVVHSFLHGGQNYTVGYDVTALMRYIREHVEAADLNDKWTWAFTHAHIKASEQERAIEALVKHKVGSKISIKKDLREAVDEAAAGDLNPDRETGDLPVVRVNHTQLHDTVERVEAVLIEHCGLMVRGDAYVMSDGNVGFVVLNEAGLRALIEENMYLEGAKGKRTPPSRLLLMHMLANQHKQAPVVKYSVSHPVVLPDSRVIVETGLDTETGIYIFTDLVELPDVSPPVGADAKQLKDHQKYLTDLVFDALDTIDKLTEDCSFASDLDRDGYVCALLTTFNRVTSGIAPSFLFVASTPATGKTTAARIIYLIATNEEMTPYSFRGDTETAKLMVPLAQRGREMLVFDNIKDGSTIDSTFLSGFMTSGKVAGRILGRSEDVDIPYGCTLIFTGNNISMSPDFASRVIPVRMDARTDRPQNRKFKHEDVYAYVMGMRAEVIKALCILTMVGLQAEKPADFVPSRFPGWDQMVRLPMLNAGCEDPIKLFDDALDRSPEHQAKIMVVNALQELVGDAHVSATEIWELALGEKSIHDRTPKGKIMSSYRADLAEGLTALNGRALISRDSCGRALAKVLNVRVGNLMLDKVRIKTGHRFCIIAALS